MVHPGDDASCWGVRAGPGGQRWAAVEMLTLLTRTVRPWDGTAPEACSRLTVLYCCFLPKHGVFFFFLAVPRGIWDLSASDRGLSPCSLRWECRVFTPAPRRRSPQCLLLVQTFIKAERVVWRALGCHAAFAVSGHLVLPRSPPEVTPHSPHFSCLGEHHFCCKHVLFF